MKTQPPIMFWIFGILTYCVSPLVTAAGNGNYQECTSKLAQSFAYCDMSKSYQDRVQALLQELNLTEKLGLLTPHEPSLNNTMSSQHILLDSKKRKKGYYTDCYAMTQDVARIGLGRYMWLVETNSQANSVCFQGKRCPTAFPGALGLAASFNTSVWYSKGDVISTELRAQYNEGGRRKWNGSFVGLTGFGPNINIARDPRFGRTSELPGEDPYLNGQYAIHYLKGLQQVDDQGHLKMLALVKHYTAYSREYKRGHDNYNISQHMLFDSYLPQYQMAFQQGKASGVMCSYNGINGHPSCSNDYLLNKIMRQQWQQPNALVMTDCGALRFHKGPPVHAPSDAHAVAWVLGNGTDVEAGDHLIGQFGPEAISKGLLEESVVDESVRRVLYNMMRVGRFDHPYKEEVSWSSIAADAIGSSEHLRVRDDAARQASILLRNLGGALPLNTAKKETIVVVGPQADTGYGLMPDYWGDEGCPNGTMACVPTLHEAIADIHTGSTLLRRGVDENSTKKTGHYDAAVSTVREHADVVVLVLGISKHTETEGIDRKSTVLPGLQNQFALDILKVAKEKHIKAIVILVNGGALSIDEMMPRRSYPPDIPSCYQSRAGVSSDTLPQQYAVVEAYNPSFGARGVAEALFGIGSASWGRMVTTMYPKKFAETHSPAQYNLDDGDGLTYRYHTGDVLATFGEGMPHENAEDDIAPINCKLLSHNQQPNAMKSHLTIQCVATNSLADRQLSALVMVYARASDKIRSRAPYPIPQRTLRGFHRVMVGPSKSETFDIDMSLEDIMLVNKQGHREALPNRHYDRLDVWDGWNSFQSFPVSLPLEHHPEGITLRSY